MQDPSRTNQELLEEISALKQRIKALEQSGPDSKQSEQKKHILLHRMQARMEATRIVIHATDEIGMIKEVCRIIVEIGRYRLAWVGYAEHDKKKTVRPVAHNGFEDGYLDTINVSWADTEHGRGPTGTAIRTGKTIIAQNILEQERYTPWRTQAIQRGYAASIAVPFTIAGTCVGALSVYAAEPQAFDVEEAKLMEELAQDLAFGISTLRDHTEHKQAEEARRGSEELYTKLIAALPDIMVRMDLNGRILFVNDFGLRMSGYVSADLIGKNMLSIIAPEDQEKAVHNTMLMMERRLGPQEYHLIMKDGRRHLFEVNGDVLRNEDGSPYGMVQICRDISERKRMEKALTKSEEKFRKAFYTSPDSVNINRLEDGIYISINPGFTRITGYTEEEIIGKTSIEYNIWDNIEDRQRLVAGLKKDGEVTNLEAAFRTRDGDIRYGLMSASIIDLDGVPHILSITRDITDRKWAEKALQESESKYRLLADNVNDVIFVLDMNLKYTYVSPSVKILRGYEPEEVLKQPSVETLTPSSWDLAMRTISEVMALEKSGRREIPMSRMLQLEMMQKDGTTVWTEVKFSFVRDENQQPVAILGVTRDITERKRTEEALKESEKKYRDLYDFLPIPVYEMDFEANITSANRAIYETFRGTEEDLKRGFKGWQLLSPEEVDKSAKNIQLLLQGKQIGGTEYTLRRLDGSVFPAIIISSVIYSNDKPVGIRGAIVDITGRRQQEEELERTIESLRKAFGAIVQVMVSAVEARDPYTAGHQIRSADLARAIATEMGLPQDKIDGIRMAGSIHDIGKLSIPAEILSKPTKLTELEISLIKEHSRNGYEMLKDVESPWPLAQIVYQHHERMDGSGYPRNLKGDEILMEARIMAVADVVESMASHRPYRPALGIGAALEEIEKNKGTLYDNAVADACLRLFRGKGYQLEWD